MNLGSLVSVLFPARICLEEPVHFLGLNHSTAEILLHSGLSCLCLKVSWKGVHFITHYFKKYLLSIYYVKVLHLVCQQIWKTQQWPQDWKRSVFIPIPKKGSAKEYSDYHAIALISHASKVMLKIFQARLQQYMNGELPDVQAGFRKGRGTRDQIANIHWIMGKAREFQKNI